MTPSLLSYCRKCKLGHEFCPKPPTFCNDLYCSRTLSPLSRVLTKYLMQDSGVCHFKYLSDASLQYTYSGHYSANKHALPAIQALRGDDSLTTDKSSGSALIALNRGDKHFNSSQDKLASDDIRKWHTLMSTRSATTKGNWTPLAFGTSEGEPSPCEACSCRHAIFHLASWLTYRMKVIHVGTTWIPDHISPVFAFPTLSWSASEDHSPV